MRRAEPEEDLLDQKPVLLLDEKGIPIVSDSISHDESSLVVIEVDGEPRIDSRLAAKDLGIEHESFMKTITTYQPRIEELGILRFEIGKILEGASRGRPGKYVFLNYDQAIFVATLSRNTEKVVDFKLKLTKAFKEARDTLASQGEKVHPIFNLVWTQRLMIFNDLTKIPKGYWCIFEKIVHVCWQEELRHIHLTHESTPDISVGQHWCRYAREVLGWDTVSLPKYLHHYPPDDPRGEYPKPANIYPNSWLGEFRTWFQSIYLEHRWPEYLKKHQLLENGEIAEPAQRRQLKPGKP